MTDIMKETRNECKKKEGCERKKDVKERILHTVG